jgi:DnaJ-class molecular chaperone
MAKVVEAVKKAVTKKPKVVEKVVEKTVTTCESCNGTGLLDVNNICVVCDGSGVVS